MDILEALEKLMLAIMLFMVAAGITVLLGIGGAALPVPLGASGAKADFIEVLFLWGSLVLAPFTGTAAALAALRPRYQPLPVKRILLVLGLGLIVLLVLLPVMLWVITSYHGFF